MKNSLNGLNSSLDTAEEVISKVENRSEEYIPLVRRMERFRRIQYTEKRQRHMGYSENRVSSSLLSIIIV